MTVNQLLAAGYILLFIGTPVAWFSTQWVLRASGFRACIRLLVALSPLLVSEAAFIWSLVKLHHH